MADTKISEFTSATSISAIDVLPIVQTVGNRKATIGQIKTFANTVAVATVAAGNINLVQQTINVVSVSGACTLAAATSDGTEVKIVSSGAGKITSIGLLPSDGYTFSGAGGVLNVIWLNGVWNVVTVNNMTLGII